MRKLSLFDVHTHVQFAAYDEDRDAVIERALDAGVWMVNIGTQRDTSAAAIELAKKYNDGVYATVGLHPSHTAESYHDSQELGESKTAKNFTSHGEEFDYEFYKTLAANPKVVAIGECGLDYYRIKNHESRIKQKEVFEKHITLSHEVGKPLMIHCRNAFDDLIQILKANSHKVKVIPGIIHFFNGTVENAKKLLDLGFSFSFGGVITFARDYDEQIKYIPPDFILLETDAPYVAPAPYRGRRNEPKYVIEVAKKLAELKNTSLEEIAEKTSTNTKNIFCV